jgi:hypothetical protein
LLLAVGAVLAGTTSYAAIADWAAEPEYDLSVCRLTPHTATFARVLGAVNPIALQAALTRWVLGRRQEATDPAAGHRPAAEQRAVLAVDGKTLRGARTGDGPPIQLARGVRPRLRADPHPGRDRRRR